MALNCKRDFDIIAVSGGGISWAMCKSVPHSRQITMPASHHCFLQMPFLLPNQQRQSTEGNWHVAHARQRNNISDR